MRKYTIALLILTMFLPSFLFPVETKAHTNKVAIVIDDFGNNMKGTDKNVITSLFH